MRTSTANIAVLIAGVLVTLIGMFFLAGNFAAGVTGFGLAHILLGILDMFRPAVREENPS